VSEYLGRNASPTSDGSFDIRPVLRVESDVFGLFPLRIACVFESHTRCLGGDRGERVGVSADSAHSPAVEANTGSVLRMVESLGRAPDPNISDIPTPPTGVSRTVLRLLQVRRNRAPSDSGLERFAHRLRIITTHCVEEELDDFWFLLFDVSFFPLFPRIHAFFFRLWLETDLLSDRPERESMVGIWSHRYRRFGRYQFR